MPDSIDRDNFIDRKMAVDTILTLDKEYYGETLLMEVALKLTGLPKADTERHAHWIEDKDITQLEITCNCCGYSYIEADPDCEERYDFCPHCGCKMDLEEVEQLKNN